ncbi:hypothetical protein [Streptomyces subrutilus]|uniref:hypothetical protein n=1 Tax=Streptomyces subrutilus TaxID=36818 RepID=UPI0033F576F9
MNGLLDVQPHALGSAVAGVGSGSGGGRFTASYRQAYGETPSQTLRGGDVRSV